MIDLLRSLLLKHEGLCLKAYRDTMGFLTIGVGHNLDNNNPWGYVEGSVITEERAMEILDHDIQVVIREADDFPWFQDLSEVRQAAILDMVFNLGMPKFKGFHHLIGALAEGDFERAKREMLNSDWANQVGQRAKTLAKMMAEDAVTQ